MNADNVIGEAGAVECDQINVQWYIYTDVVHYRGDIFSKKKS